MWSTRAVKKKQKTKEMLEMAKVYKKSGSLHEFLVEIDLTQFKHISTYVLTNPFVIYGMTKKYPTISGAGFSLIVISIGLLVFAFPGCLYAKIAIASIQGALMFIQLYVSIKALDASQALSKVAFAELDTKFAKLAKALCIPSKSSQQASFTSNV